MKKEIGIELIPTSSFDNKMIIIYPHKMKLDQLPTTPEELVRRILNLPKEK